ncbi:MAG: outer membrane protein assembly factor BamD [Sphingobacteriales bacterium]|nr:MAG: outer membrane protein assembly factor BamD [Sphingobacteriales bacterium]TAF82720.1 MAG: outer membrane protein assembly factor BamD [Sphingobacteriales bacterium]
MTKKYIFVWMLNFFSVLLFAQQNKIDLGYTYEQNKQPEKANKIYDKAISQLKPDENVINEMANVFYMRQNYTYALKTFIQGRKILNNKTAFSLQIINCLAALKNKNDVINETLILLNYDTNYVDYAKKNLAKTLTDSIDYALLKTLILKQLQKQPDNTNLTKLLIWQYLQQKDFKSALAQTIALDKRNQQDGELVFEIAEIFNQNKDYQTACKAYQYLIAKGNTKPYYIIAQIQNLNNKKQLLTEGTLLMPDVQSLENDYNTLLNNYGKNYQTLFAIIGLAQLQAYYLNKPTQAQNLLLNALQLHNITQQQIAELKLQLGDIYLINNTIWEAALLYSQVEKAYTNQPLGQEAKLRNAKLSFYNADFKWAQSQLDVLKASTSQLIANDALDLGLLIQDNLIADSTGKALKMYAFADLNVLKNNLPKALLVLDSITTQYPNGTLKDDVLLTKAKIFIKQNNNQAAALQYQTIINQHSQDMYIDDALFLLAKLQEEKLGLTSQAQQNYQNLINNYPSSPYITEARQRYRALRGDAL